MLIIDSIKSLGRSKKELLEIFLAIFKKECKFKLLSGKDKFISDNISNFINALTIIIEYEGYINNKKIKDGIKSARGRGKIGGRPKISQEDINRALELYYSNALSISEISKTTGVSQSTLYRRIKKICNNQN